MKAYININRRENTLKNLDCDGTRHIEGGRMSLEEAESIIFCIIILPGVSSIKITAVSCSMTQFKSIHHKHLLSPTHDP